MMAFFDLETFQNTTFGFTSKTYTVGYTKLICINELSQTGTMLTSLVRKKDSEYCCDDCFKEKKHLAFRCKHCSLFKFPYECCIPEIKAKRSRVCTVSSDICFVSGTHEFFCFFHPENKAERSDLKSNYVIADEMVDVLFQTHLHNYFRYKYATGDESNVIHDFFEDLSEDICSLLDTQKRFLKFKVIMNKEELKFQIQVLGFNSARFDTLYVLKQLGSEYTLFSKSDGSSPIFGGSRGMLLMEIEKDVTSRMEHRIDFFRNNITQSKCGIYSVKAYTEALAGFSKVVISFCFKDVIRLGIPTSLCNLLKGEKVPAVFLKGDFNHEKIDSFESALRYREEVVPYLKNDVMGLFIYFSSRQVMFRENLMVKQIKNGVEHKTNVNLHDYITLPSMAASYVSYRSRSDFSRYSTFIMKDSDDNLKKICEEWFNWW